MKKLLALALAVVMMMAIALPAFAANGSESKSSWGDTDKLTDAAANKYENFDNVVLEYGVAQGYEVTIPADINFGYMNDIADGNPFQDKRTVSVSNVVIAGTERLVLTVASASSYTQTGASQTTPKTPWTMADLYGKSTAVSYTATLGTLNYASEARDDETRANAVFSETYDNNNTYGDGKVYTVMVIEPATGNTGITPDNGASIEITFATAGTAQEGLYQDTLTFTVEIIDGYNSTFENEVKVGPTAPAEQG